MTLCEAMISGGLLWRRQKVLCVTGGPFVYAVRTVVVVSCGPVEVTYNGTLVNPLLAEVRGHSRIGCCRTRHKYDKYVCTEGEAGVVWLRLLYLTNGHFT